MTDSTGCICDFEVAPVDGCPVHDPPKARTTDDRVTADELAEVLASSEGDVDLRAEMALRLAREVQQLRADVERLTALKVPEVAAVLDRYREAMRATVGPMPTDARMTDQAGTPTPPIPSDEIVTPPSTLEDEHAQAERWARMHRGPAAWKWIGNAERESEIGKMLPIVREARQAHQQAPLTDAQACRACGQPRSEHKAEGYAHDGIAHLCDGFVFNDGSKGLYRKFDVQRTDGSSGPGRKHEKCEYFVLDWQHDPFTVPAVLAYAEACEAEFPALAADLRRRVLRGDIPPEVRPQRREIDNVEARNGLEEPLGDEPTAADWRAYEDEQARRERLGCGTTPPDRKA